MRGFGAPEVLEAYARAESLCDLLGERADIFPALWGQWMFRWGRSEGDDAWRLSARLLALAEKSDNVGLRLQAHHAVWATSFGRGELAETCAHADAGLALYDAKTHQAMASSYGNHDASTCARNFAAFSLALAGDDERARTMAESSLAVARKLNDPFFLALTFFFTSAVAQVLGDVAVAATNSEASRQVAMEHDLPVPKAWSTGVAGWCVAESGESDRGIALLNEAVAALHAMQSRQFISYLLGLLADVNAKAGRHAEAMKVVNEGIAVAEATGERFYLAELYRLHGELCAHPAIRQKKKAEESFRIAIKIAKDQGAASIEHKASDSRRNWCG
jgi:adenylate cyclase